MIKNPNKFSNMSIQIIINIIQNIGYKITIKPPFISHQMVFALQYTQLLVMGKKCETQPFYTNRKTIKVALIINMMNMGEWTYQAPIHSLRVNTNLQQHLTTCAAKYSSKTILKSSHILSVDKLWVKNLETGRYIWIKKYSNDDTIMNLLQNAPLSKTKYPYLHGRTLEMKVNLRYRWRWPQEEIRKKIAEDKKVFKQLGDFQCPITYEFFDVPYKLKCGHIFSYTVIWKLYKQEILRLRESPIGQQPYVKCPLCRQKCRGGQVSKQIIKSVIKLMAQ